MYTTLTTVSIIILFVGIVAFFVSVVLMQITDRGVFALIALIMLFGCFIGSSICRSQARTYLNDHIDEYVVYIDGQEVDANKIDLRLYKKISVDEDNNIVYLH